MPCAGDATVRILPCCGAFPVSGAIFAIAPAPECVCEESACFRFSSVHLNRVKRTPSASFAGEGRMCVVYDFEGRRWSAGNGAGRPASVKWFDRRQGIRLHRARRSGADRTQGHPVARFQPAATCGSRELAGRGRAHHLRMSCSRPKGWQVAAVVLVDETSATPMERPAGRAAPPRRTGYDSLTPRLPHGAQRRDDPEAGGPLEDRDRQMVQSHQGLRIRGARSTNPAISSCMWRRCVDAGLDDLLPGESRDPSGSPRVPRAWWWPKSKPLLCRTAVHRPPGTDLRSCMMTNRRGAASGARGLAGR